MSCVLQDFEIAGSRTGALSSAECAGGCECESPLGTVNSWDSHSHYRRRPASPDLSLYSGVILYCDHSHFRSPTGFFRLLLLVSIRYLSTACLWPKRYILPTFHFLRSSSECRKIFFCQQCYKRHLRIMSAPSIMGHGTEDVIIKIETSTAEQFLVFHSLNGNNLLFSIEWQYLQFLISLLVFGFYKKYVLFNTCKYLLLLVTVCFWQNFINKPKVF